MRLESTLSVVVEMGTVRRNNKCALLSSHIINSTFKMKYMIVKPLSEKDAQL